MTEGSPKHVRIFISSPSDVAAERDRARKVIAEVDADLDSVTLEAIRWEDRYYTADSTFQSQVPSSSETDLVVCILWSRLGTQLPPEKFQRPDGTPYGSGTEFEYETALEAKLDEGVPDIAMFRKTAPAELDIGDDVRFELEQEQLNALNNFWRKWFRSEEGHFTTAFNTFASPDEFETRFEGFLRQWLADRGFLADQVDWPASKGSPYRGLEVFEEEHAPIFFGRRRQVDWARARLMAAAERGTAFLLVLGMSGVGKSSLVRAGLVPRLKRSGAVPGVDEWRRIIIRPLGAGADPFEVLARALYADDALPELAAGDYGNADDYLTLLRKDPEGAMMPLKGALRRAGEALAKQENSENERTVRLLLIVDQFEESFSLSSEIQNQFAALLRVLADSGIAWVIATMRSDLYSNLQARPGLVTLKEAGAQFDVEPPSQGDLDEIIVGPARAAGLTFESDAESGQNLAEVLEAEAGDMGALPLLEFTLDELYKARDQEKDCLTFAAYRRLGGLAGALKTRAEAVYEGLSPAMKEELPAVMRALVSVGAKGETTARIVAWDELCSTEARAGLVGEFVKERLLVAFGDKDARRVRIAHEALLTHWDRLRSQIEQDKGDIALRGRLASAARQWRDAAAKDKAGYLLPPGKPLSDGEDLVARIGGELTEDIRDLVRDSRRAEEVRAKRAQRIWASVAAVALLLSAVAVFFAIQANLANEQLEAANDQLETANATLSERNVELKEQTDRARAALAGQSHQRAQLVDALIDRGDAGIALALALENVPVDPDDPEEVPLVPAARTALERAIVAQPAYVFPHTEAISDVSFHPTEAKVLTASSLGKGASVWNADTGERILELEDDGGAIVARYSGDGARIITGSWDNVARVWDSLTGDIVLELYHDNSVDLVELDADGSHAVTADWGGDVWIWDIDGEESIASFEVSVDVTTIAISADGKRAALGTNDGDIALIDVDKGEVIAERNYDNSWVNDMTFTPNGKHLISGLWTDDAVMWDAETGDEVRFFEGHLADITTVDVSSDSLYLVTSSDDRTARVWSIETGEQLLQLNHDNIVYSARFGFEDGWIVTASRDRTARVWDAFSGDEVATYAHNDEVLGADLDPGGQSVVYYSDSDQAILRWIDQVPYSTFFEHGEAIGEVFFTPDGDHVVVSVDGDNEPVLKLWNVETSELVRDIPVEVSVYDMAVAPAGMRAATADGGGMVQVWDLGDGSRLAMLDAGGAVDLLRFSPDGDRLFAIAGDRVLLWAVDGERLIAELAHDGAVNDAAFSHNGDWLATASFDDFARLYDARSGELVSSFDAETIVQTVDFSPDDTMIAIGAWDDIVYLVDRENLTLIDRLQHEDAVRFAEFSQDGSLIVTSTADRVRVWDVETRTPQGIATLSGTILTYKHAQEIAVSPDNNLVMTTTANQYARLWSTVNGSEMGILRQIGDTTAVTFSPDGQRAATADYGGFVTIWDLSRISLGYLPFEQLRAYGEARQVSKLAPHDRKRFRLGQADDFVFERGELPDDPAARCDYLAGDLDDPAITQRGSEWEEMWEDQEAIDACVAAVEAHPDDPKYLFQLGRAYLRTEDAARGVAPIRQAADMGHPMAYFYLAFLHRQGWLLEFDQAKAMDYYLKAAELNLPIAYNEIGYMYWNAEGVDFDEAKAYENWHEAARLGMRYGHMALGNQYGPQEDSATAAQAVFHYSIAERLMEAKGEVLLARIARSRRAAVAGRVAPEDAAENWMRTKDWKPAHDFYRLDHDRYMTPR